ncbi:hypothetical protein [Kineosporia sp. R_H_3]|uniref:hypothetical protein n=1 Tax=Kineosporia sp. R_H_3 TaxID=1961848 RepID=UPI000B4BE6E6|nr:hypothetical protein [Kineosporia sp. R_H_3]
MNDTATPVTAPVHGHDHAPDDPAHDHDHSRHTGDVVPLPGNPDLKQLATQAKDLRRGVRRGVPDDVATVAAHHPRGAELTATAAGRAALTLRDAQVALARKHGFEGWQALVQNVGRARVEERDMHRWFGVELNNEVWSLLGDGITPDSPQDDKDLVLYGAYASARHWRECGDAANAARAEHAIARAALAVGEPDVALRHARRCLALVEANPDVTADWDAPFAHEALARALAATGDLEAGRAHRETAVRLTAACADPGDREVLEAELSRAPWFGLDA